MSKVKVNLLEAKNNKKGLIETILDISTNIRFSNRTNINAQQDLVSIVDKYGNSRDTLNTILLRDAKRIETLTIEFLEIDYEISKK